MKKIKILWQKTRKLKTADILAAFAIIVAIIYGGWGVHLTKMAIKTSVDVHQFDTLLSKTDSNLYNQSLLLKSQGQLIVDQNKLLVNSNTQIISLLEINTKLSKQLNFLSKQTESDNQIQKLATANEKRLENINKSDLLIAAKNLLYLPQNEPQGYDTYYDTVERFKFLDKIDQILETQINNPYLIENNSFFERFKNLKDSILDYQKLVTIIKYDPYNKIRGYGITNPHEYVTHEWSMLIGYILILGGDILNLFENNIYW